MTTLLGLYRPLASAVAVTALLGSSLCAQSEPPPATDGSGEPQPSEAVRIDDEIVVTATRGARELADLPVSVTVVGRDQIRAAAATTTDDLLRTIPGIQLPPGDSTVNHPLSNFVSMRGLSGARALVLLDGQPMNDAFFGFVPFDEAPLGEIDRVEVVRGGSSSLYGSYALGGVIQLLTRPIETRRLDLRLEGGTQATRRGGLFAAERRGTLGLSLSADAFDTDGYQTLAAADRGAIDVASRTESTNLKLKLEQSIGETFSWHLRADRFDQEGIAGTRLSRNAREATGASAGANWQLAADGELALRLFARRQQFDSDNVDVPFFGGRSSEFVSNAHRTPGRDFGGSAVWNRGGSGRLRTLTAGVDLRRITGEDRSRNAVFPGVFDALEVGSGEQRSAGAFVQGSLVLGPRAELLLSARYDAWRNLDGRRELTPAAGAPDVERFADRSADEINPRLAVRFQAAPGLGLRAAAYRAFRAPNLDELYRTSSLSGSALVANPRLDPEILVGAEVGFDWAQGPLRAQVSAFRNEVEDRISFVATAFFPVFVLEVQNVGKARSDGIEAMVAADLGAGLSLDLGYAHTDSKIVENVVQPALVGKKVAGVPEEAASLGLTWRQAAGGTVALRGRHVGARFADSFNTEQLEAHEVFDLSASWPLGRRIEIFGVGQNLLDEEYAVSTFGGRILGAPRRVFGGLRVSFE